MIAGDLIGRNDPGFSKSSLLTSISSSATNLLDNSLILDFATSVLPIISRMLPKVGLSVPMIFLGDSSALQSAIRNMSHPSTSQLICQQSIDHQIIYMIFHRLVNNGNAVRALDESETSLDHFFKIGITYCFSLRGNVLSSIVNSIPSPYNLALMQNIFCAALILGHGPVLELIMDMDQGSLANRPIALEGYQYYPLEYTSLRGHVQATQVLLNHCADPNLHKDEEFLTKIGKMSFNQQYNREARAQIMRLLIDSGLEVDPGSALHHLMYANKNELLLLATHYMDKSFEAFFRRRALPGILLRPDWDDPSSKTLRAILDRAFSDRINRQDLWNSVLSESLASAVLCKNTSAVDILLAKGAKPDVHCLISAAQSDDVEIFKNFLDHGLDPNVPVPEPSWEDGYNYGWDEDSTALSVSIRNRSRGAFLVLRAQGFISNLAHQPAGFISALIAACQIGDSTLVEQLLSLPNLPRKQARIGEALEAAIEENQHHIIGQLLSVGVKPTIRCLELAIQNQQLTVVKLLANYMDLSGVLETEQYDDQSIIFNALEWGDQTAIEYVLRIGYPVNVLGQLSDYDSQGWELKPDLQPPGTVRHWILTPLSAAILKRNSAAVKSLMAYGAQVVLYNSHFTSYQFRLEHTSRWSLTPLAAAAVRNDIPLTKEFLRIGADPFDNGALFVCAVLDLEDIIMLLLAAFKNRYPDGAQSFGSDALYQTMRHNNRRLLGLLAQDTDITGPVERDRKPDWYISSLPPLDTGFTSPLGEAIRIHSACAGANGVLDLLLPLVKDFNVIVHATLKHGKMTCLLYAISLNSLDTVRKLHRAGANISLPAEWGILRTPLQAAVQAESKEIVEYLLLKDVDPNELPAPQAGATALQLAAITGNVGIATILLDADAKVNAPPALCDVRTAFEGATEHGRIEMMLFLVHHGADLLSNDNEQYRRAVKFAEDNSQYAAKRLADDLHEKALGNHEASFIGMGVDAWTGPDMTDFGTSFLKRRKSD